MLNERKCAIIGCGFVGATTAYTLMQSGMFSEMVLIDIDKKKAEGEAADLGHGLPFHAPMDIYAGDYSDLSDCFLIIITAGANQKPGETRIDLVRRNVTVFTSIVSSIVKYNDEAILLVVTNPVDILTHVTCKLSGFPPERVIGSGTVLDTARLKYLIGRKLGVDSRNVHSFIIGEHGDSELPVFSSANISGIDLNHFCGTGTHYKLCDACDTASLFELFEDAKNSAYHIIENKGATYYAIAESVKRIVTAIIKDENAILPVSALLEDYYGISNLCLGVPCVVGKSGIQNVLEIPLDARELSLLRESANKLRGIVDELETQAVI